MTIVICILLQSACLWTSFMAHCPGGRLPYESDGDARRKLRIKPLKETNLGVVQALFDP